MLNIGDGFSLPIEAVTQTFAIIAKRGVGKTYAALVLVEELLAAHAQVVIADPVGVTWGLRAAANGKDPGLPIIVMGGDHGDVPLEAAAGKVIAEFIVDTRSSVVLDLSLLRKGDQVRFMTDFAETLYHRNRAPLHLVLDEADAFAPQRPMRGQERMLGAVQDLVRRGRARGIGVTLVTQRAAVLSKDVLTQVEVLVALRTIAPQDRDAIEAWIQAHDAHGQRAEFMASLASLPIGTAWFWSPGWLDVFRCVKIRFRRTFDSSATPTVGMKASGPQRLAPVDLESLRSRIAATIEKAKAEDPRELKRRIAELEAELRSKGPQRTLAVKVAVLSEPLTRRLEVATRKLAALEERYEQATTRLVDARGRVLAATQAIEQRLLEARTPASMPTHAPACRSMLRDVVIAPPRPTSTHQARAADLALPPGERIVLTAIAQHAGGVTREQLTVLTGYRRSSRDTYVQRLHRRDLIAWAGDHITATDAAVAALGGEFEALPVGDALREYWMKRLSAGERRCLMVAAEAFPKAVDREHISALTGYRRSSRDTYLQRLSAGKLIIVERGGLVRASEALFG